jgi:selenocysteine lyase/cysteine desulfurase
MPGLSSDVIDKCRDDFPFLARATYLDNASVSPLGRSTMAAMMAHAELVVNGPGNAHLAAQPIYDRGRALAAKTVGGKEDRVAYIQNTSHGLSLLALGIGWRRGDNVVVHDMEFPSNLHCWTQLEASGVEIRRVRAREGRLTADAFREAIDRATRVVAVSQVQYYSGYRVDIATLGEICQRQDALLVVDGTQSIGALRLDTAAAGVDVVCVSAHKWLAGPRGIGFMCLSDRAFERITPRIVGWRSVAEPFGFSRTLDFAPDGRRFESGCENGSGMTGLASRLQQIDDCGPQAIEERVLELAEHVRLCCRKEGLSLPLDFSYAERSGITLIDIGGADPERLMSYLKAREIHLSIRGGMARLSANYYNTEAELDRAIGAISAFVRNPAAPLPGTNTDLAN